MADNGQGGNFFERSLSAIWVLAGFIAAVGFLTLMGGCGNWSIWQAKKEPTPVPVYQVPAPGQPPPTAPTAPPPTHAP